ncbi:RNA methyltransferase [Panacibacter ginsenosidivorans]|uniref:RNA methyltransferase n=1 Tax=Panacibacter ginsenosidivorans TaxID=1813871 RepID=A0A5B8VBQ3_9BACT|nr:RNA methyltransferase [Panacibacter ginsenosidivorans]QEC68957.1 RNA methyltransferase [Panacibacter ginsenosidivorans]
MISKNEIKYIQSLYHKKVRDEAELFIAEGIKLVDELLNSPFVIRKIYATKEWAGTAAFPATIITEQHELDKISNLSTPNQVLAIVEQKKLTHQPIEKNKITLVLDGIQDPGNLGTIIRTADWFGITQIIANTDTADVYNSKVVQSTMGSIIRVNVWYKDIEQWLSTASVPVFGALLNGQSIYKTTKIKEGILVIGNESKGIRSNILPFIKHAITIPGSGHAESLNAAVATGIILSHLLQ